KTMAAARDQAVQALEHQFQQIFADRHRTGLLDLEAVELAIRSTVHETGAAAIRELSRCHPPERDHRAIPCACGHTAKYEGMRSRPVLTAVAGHRSTDPTISALHATARPKVARVAHSVSRLAPGNANWAACLRRLLSMIRAGLSVTRVPPPMLAD